LNPPCRVHVGYSARTLAPPNFDTRTLVSFDGTPIAFHKAGAWNDDDAPVIVLANGLGGTYGAFRHQVAYLEKTHRFLTWDYRGLFGSARPRDPAAFTVDAHVRDMFEVLDAAKVDRAVLVGWSMGVQVSLEALKRRPDLARGLVLLNGTFGRPFRTLPGGIIAQRVVPQVILGLRRYHGLTSSALRRVVGWPETIAWLKRLGMIGPTIDEDVFTDTVAAFGTMDMDAYFRTLHALGDHDADDVLAAIKVPTLMITGERDLMTPPRTARRIVDRIPGAELLVVKGGTHYTAVEYPELVNLRIERFLREHKL
jgi:pimeloyl-ACP methyl ester carboxylesterase